MNKKEVEAILVMVLGLLFFYFLFEKVWLLSIAFGTGMISLLIPFVGKWLVKGWLKLAEGLGWVNSRILLSIIFFLILTPIAIVSRLFKKNSLRLKNDTNSIWVERNKTYTKKDLEKMW
ncbi:MAG: SxtJ family membrane protein [Saprospiraceae bacterium]|mgnify:CR=1 FL=1